MNSSTNTFLPLLDFLRDLMPPSHITLMGAGNGNGVWAQWLNAQAAPATLVEAGEQQFAALKRQQAAGNFAQASLLHGVVAAEAGEVAFYTSSLAAESGLLPSEDLQPLWPNAHTLQSSQRHAIALVQLLASGQAHQWLLLDCLPAAALVHGAAAALAQVDVVVARVLLTENQAHPIPGAGLAELAALLPELTQIALQPSRHPAIGHVLLVRNYRKKEEQQAQIQKALEADLAETKKAKDAETQAKQAALQARDAEAKAKETLQAQLKQAEHANVELLKKQELQTQTQQVLEADLTKITQAHVAEAKARQAAVQAQEGLQAQLKQAEHAKADLFEKQECQAQERQVLVADLAQAKKNRDAEFKAKEALQTQLQQLQDQNADLLKKLELLIEKEKDFELKEAAFLEKLKNISKIMHFYKKDSVERRDLFRREVISNDKNKYFLFENLEVVTRDFFDIEEDSFGKRIEKKFIDFGAGKMDFYYRPDSVGDVGVMRQIFTEKQYECDWLFQGKIIRKIFDDIKKDELYPLIIDAGSNIGASALWFNARFKGSVVVCIEPENNNCDILRKNCAGKSLFLFEGGLSDKAKIAYLNDPGESDWGFRVDNVSNANPIACISVDDVLKSFPEDKYKPLVLKIDVEGSEDQIFENPELWINKIPLIIVELHDWMLPKKNTSTNVLRTLCKYDFEIVTRGENIFCFNKSLIY